MKALGSYPAERTAALSGVPKSTVYYWARKGILEPSVSREDPKLWSFKDLLALRVIDWLRRPKQDNSFEDLTIAPSRMSAITAALNYLRELNLDLFEGGRPIVAVTPDGRVLVNRQGREPIRPGGQTIDTNLVDVISPFSTTRGIVGPDLSQPRPLLRIVPQKLAGAPHIVDTRVDTQVLDSLYSSGYSIQQITSLYPFVEPRAIRQSLELERQLRQNLHPKAA